METLRYFTAKGNNDENKDKESHQTQVSLIFLQRDFLYSITLNYGKYCLICFRFFGYREHKALKMVLFWLKTPKNKEFLFLCINKKHLQSRK